MTLVSDLKLIDSCALRYYHKNKERINKQRAIDRIAKQKGTHIVRQHPSKGGELISRRQGAILMGITQYKLTNIVSRTTRFNCPETVTPEGRVKYKVKDLIEWKSKNLDLFKEGHFIEADTYQLSKHVMLLINWLQASKHVTKYCNTQRVAINSNQFWSRWA